jgi:hypothetical protein
VISASQLDATRSSVVGNPIQTTTTTTTTTNKKKKKKERPRLRVVVI